MFNKRRERIAGLGIAAGLALTTGYIMVKDKLPSQWGGPVRYTDIYATPLNPAPYSKTLDIQPIQGKIKTIYSQADHRNQRGWKYMENHIIITGPDGKDYVLATSGKLAKIKGLEGKVVRVDYVPSSSISLTSPCEGVAGAPDAIGFLTTESEEALETR
jgi:hypothetical protein